MTSVGDTVVASPAAHRGSSAPSELRACEACGTPLAAPPGTRGRVRRFCTDTCKKRAQRAAQRPSNGSQEAPQDLNPAPSPSSPANEGVSAGQRITGQDSPWYLAKFAAPPSELGRCARRSIRYKLRQLLNQVSEVDRCKRCGREVLGGAAAVIVKGGVAHFAGVETCGRVWLCPVCAAKIRARRGDEVAEAVGRHLAAGGAAYFVTATLPHDQGDALTASLDVLTAAWRSLMWGKAGQTDKARFGIIGNIKTVEITHGRHGWHPHIHAVILVNAAVGVLDLYDWLGRLDARWARALVRNGWSAGQSPYRFRLDPVTRDTAHDLAAYVTKIQEGGGLGNEIARADLKHGRMGSRTPLQILADFGTNGEVADLELWLEYERATAGKSAIRWSRGLRALLLPEVQDLTDEEIAAEEIGGDTVAFILPHTWYRLASISGAQTAVLEAIEADGWEGLIRVLVAYRIDTDGLLTPEEWAIQGH